MAERGFSVRLTANTASYEAAMRRAAGSTATMAATSTRDMDKLGNRISNLGGQMTKAVTLPIVGAGVAAIKMSADFESSFAKMQGLAGVTADEVDDLKASVLDLAGRTAQAPQQLADALYQASSSGLDTAQAMKAVERAATASAAGMGRSADIVSLVASATASYGEANIDAARATDILTATIREGRADPEELAGTLGRVLPIAAKLGVSFEEVGGATAYLSNVFGDTNRTVTAMSGIMAKLVSPTKQGRDALADMGTSMDELQAAIDEDGLMGALELLRSHGFEGNQQALRALFDDIEAFQGITALLSADQQDLAGIMDATTNSVGAADEAFKVMSETAGFKMKQAWVQVQSALIQAGDIIMPIVAGVAGAIGQLAEIFSDLPGPVQMIVVGFLGLVAAAGPVLMVAGSMVRNFNQVKTAVTNMGRAGTTASLALGAVGLVLIAATAWYADNAKRKAELTAITNGYVDALNAEREGQEGAVDAATTKILADKQLVDMAKKHGLSVQDLAKIIRGEVVPAYEELKSQTDDGDSWWNPFDSPNSGDTSGNEIRGLIENVDQLAAGYEGAVEQFDLTIEVERELAAATTEADRETRRLTAGIGGLGDSVDQVVLSEEEQADALQAVTDELNRQVKALEDDLEAQEALIEFARRAADAQYALADSIDDYDRFLEQLPGKLDEINKSKDTEAEKVRQTNALYREGSKTASQLADDVVAAYDEAADGATTAKEKGDLWRQSMLNSALAASGPVRQSILDFIFAVNEVPAEKQVAIVAAVEANDLTTAIALLDGASETRKVEVQADVDETALGKTKGQLKKLEDPLTATLFINADTSAVMLKLGRIGSLNASASGRYVDHPMISTLGEGGRPEVVLPLTNEARMAELMSDRRVSGPILGALGGTVASANGRVVNLTHMSIPAQSTTSAAVSETVSGPSSADINSAQDKLMQRQFERDAISYEVYREYLAKRKEGLELYSDEEQELFDRIQQLDQNKAKARERDAQIQLDMADRIKQYQYETNQISLADYQAYLAGRRDSYGAYTTEWFALTNQMAEVQRRMDQASADATKAVFDQADAAKQLADATAANLEADAEYNAAAAKAAAAKGPDKQAAIDEFNRSAANHAATAYNFTEAQANSQGLRPGTPEWARFMRARLTEDSVYSHAIGRGNLGDAIDRLLLGIPSFAYGGYIPATPGGRLIRVAEAGQGEYMTPANRMHAMAGAGGGSVYAPVYHISISGAIDRPGVARELREILGEHDRRNGLN